MLEDWIEEMKEECKTIQAFIAENEGNEVSKDNVDSIIFPANDGKSQYALKIMAQEQAIEDSIENLKSDFRKKRIGIEDYLRLSRELTDEKFMLIHQSWKLQEFLKTL